MPLKRPKWPQTPNISSISKNPLVKPKSEARSEISVKMVYIRVNLKIVSAVYLPYIYGVSVGYVYMGGNQYNDRRSRPPAPPSRPSQRSSLKTLHNTRVEQPGAKRMAKRQGPSPMRRWVAARPLRVRQLRRRPLVLQGCPGQQSSCRCGAT